MGKYQGYEKYKDSGVEWLGAIPEHWSSPRLRFAIDINPSKREVTLKQDELVSFVPMESVREYGGIDLEFEKTLEDVFSSYTYFADNDVVFAKITPCFENGKSAIAKNLKNGIGFGTTELHVLRAGESTNNHFLFYIIISHLFQHFGEAEMYGAGGQKRVPENYIKNFRFAFPPLDEQESIAHFLDRKTSQIDTLIAKKSALLEKLDEKRTALISHAVTKGLDSSVPMKDSGVEWLGDIPEHWEVKRLRFLVVMQGGSTPNKANPEFWDGEIPWISAKDLKTERLKSSVDTITDKALQETSIHIHPKNGVVIVVRGMILAHSFPVAINDIDITINQDLKVLRTSQNAEFLAILLRGVKKIVLSIMEESGHGTKVLRTDLFKNVELPHPPQVEQGEIVNYVNQKTAEIDRQKVKVKEAIELLKEYRTALITNAVTGKIDVRQVDRV